MNQESGDTEILVVGICGSLRSGSYTRMAVEIALRGAQDAGAKIRMIDLRDYKLTLCDGPREDDTYPKEESRRLARACPRRAGPLVQQA